MIFLFPFQPTLSYVAFFWFVFARVFDNTISCPYRTWFLSKFRLRQWCSFQATQLFLANYRLQAFKRRLTFVRAFSALLAIGFEPGEPWCQVSGTSSDCHLCQLAGSLLHYDRIHFPTILFVTLSLELRLKEIVKLLDRLYRTEIMCTFPFN